MISVSYNVVATDLEDYSWLDENFGEQCQPSIRSGRGNRRHDAYVVVANKGTRKLYKIFSDLKFEYFSSRFISQNSRFLCSSNQIMRYLTLEPITEGDSTEEEDSWPKFVLVILSVSKVSNLSDRRGFIHGRKKWTTRSGDIEATEPKAVGVSSWRRFFDCEEGEHIISSNSIINCSISTHHVFTINS